MSARERAGQEVLVNELVAAVSSLQRLAAYNLARNVLASAPAQLASGVIAALGPWRSLLLPLPTPLELLSQCALLPGWCSCVRCGCIRPPATMPAAASAPSWYIRPETAGAV
jgi:hypothetical protein